MDKPNIQNQSVKANHPRSGWFSKILGIRISKQEKAQAAAHALLVEECHKALSMVTSWHQKHKKTLNNTNYIVAVFKSNGLWWVSYTDNSGHPKPEGLLLLIDIVNNKIDIGTVEETPDVRIQKYLTKISEQSKKRLDITEAIKQDHTVVYKQYYLLHLKASGALEVNNFIAS
jgi:hypothetical protein